MQCHNCGKEVANGAKFCKYCGSRLTEKQESSDIAEKQDVPEEGEDKDAKDEDEQGRCEAVRVDGLWAH